MSYGTTVNREKNGALLAYIAQRIPKISLRKLLKIIYLIDERFVMLRGFPLTWFNYQAWAKGPVAPEVYAVKNGAFDGYVSCEKNEDDTDIVSPALAHDYLIDKKMEEFSVFEKNIIDEQIDLYRNKTADYLTDMTHEDTSLWSKVVREQNVAFADGKSKIEVPLHRLNDNRPEMAETYNDALEYMQFCNAASPC